MTVDQLRITDGSVPVINGITSIEYDGCPAIPGTHYDIKATPSYNGTEVTIHLDVVPRVDNLIVTTMYFQARYDGGKWHYEKNDIFRTVYSDEFQKLQLEAAIIHGEDVNEPGKLDDVTRLKAFLDVNGFHASNVFIDGNTMSQGIAVTGMGKEQKKILDGIIAKNGWHVRSQYTTKAGKNSIETHGAWITRKGVCLKERDVNTLESLTRLLEDCGFEHSYQEPIDFSTLKSNGQWEVHVLTKLKEKIWIDDHLKIPNTTVTLSSGIVNSRGVPGMVFSTIVKGGKKLEKFPSNRAIRAFMRDIKLMDTAEIENRMKKKTSGGLLGVADKTSLYLETDEMTPDLKSKLDAFCSGWGVKWESERVYDVISITIHQ